MYIISIGKNKTNTKIIGNHTYLKLFSNTDLIPLIILLVVLFFMPLDVLARDLSGGITSVGSEITRVMMILGPIMLIVAGGVFWFSKQAGMERLMSTIIGIAIFAASGTIFATLYRAFN